MSEEIELKLEVSPASVAALIASDLIADQGSEVVLNATYFDTRSHELHRQGHSLRIRHAEGMAVQTVKSGDAAAGLFARGEWELPVDGRRPVADRRTPVSDLLGTRSDELLPLFDVVTSRHKVVVRSGGSEIEVAIDHAEAKAGSRSTVFCEVELELLAGDPSALFALARTLDAIAHIRISVQSKAERGYELLGPLADFVRAEKTALVPTMDLPAAFAAIAADCLRQYRLNETILLDRYVPEAVHQARIGLRRLRSAMVLFKDLLAGPERDRLNAGLRDLARCLGEARDLDVLVAEAQPGPVLERLSHARDSAHSAINRKLRAKTTRMLMLDISEWIAAGSWRGDAATRTLRETPLSEFAAARLDRLRRKLAKHGRHFADLEPEARHRVRKDTKKLRYGVEFLQPLFDAKARRKKFARALETLQDELGALNDRATAEERLASLGLVGTQEVEEFLANWQTGNLLEAAADARRALLDVKPFWR